MYLAVYLSIYLTFTFYIFICGAHKPTVWLSPLCAHAHTYDSLQEASSYTEPVNFTMLPAATCRPVGAV